MSDAMWLEGKEYISSKRASHLSGYAQDYIGQLARKGLIDAERVGGLWFISLPSLTEYKSNADSYIPPQPERKTAPEVDSLISFDGKDHISASRAAQITGYHPDYVGQLARSGAIISRQVGNRWYIDREGILAHKKEKDSLLGAVQAQSVGLARQSAGEGIPTKNVVGEERGRGYGGPGPFLTYTTDERDLLPIFESEKVLETQKTEVSQFVQQKSEQSHIVPIRKVLAPILDIRSSPEKTQIYSREKVPLPAKTINNKVFKGLATVALTVVIVLSFGFVTLKSNAVYVTNIKQGGAVIQRNMFTAGAAEALLWAGDFLQNLLAKDIVYKRAF